MFLELKVIQNTSGNQWTRKAANGIVMALGLDWQEHPACSNKQQEQEPPVWNTALVRNAVFRAPPWVSCWSLTCNKGKKKSQTTDGREKKWVCKICMKRAPVILLLHCEEATTEAFCVPWTRDEKANVPRLSVRAVLRGAVGCRVYPKAWGGCTPGSTVGSLSWTNKNAPK